MISKKLLLVILPLLALSACADLYDPTPRPDYVIRVTPNAAGGTASMPACPSYATATADPFDNQPLPQFGCANAQNLAAMVERPDDLVEGRRLANARGVTSVGAIRRFDNDQTRGLIWTGNEDNQVAATTSSTSASPLSGDITGGTSSGASSGSTSSSSGASASSP